MTTYLFAPKNQAADLGFGPVRFRAGQLATLTDEQRDHVLAHYAGVGGAPSLVELSSAQVSALADLDRRRANVEDARQQVEVWAEQLRDLGLRIHAHISAHPGAEDVPTLETVVVPSGEGASTEAPSEKPSVVPVRAPAHETQQLAGKARPPRLR